MKASDEWYLLQGFVLGGQHHEGSDCLSLLYPCEAPSGVLHSALEPATIVRCGTFIMGPEEGVNDDLEGRKHLSHKDRLRELSFCSFWRRKGYRETSL